MVALVPDRGGTAEIVVDRTTGFHFKADDHSDVIRMLERLRTTSASHLDAVADAARRTLSTRFSATEGARRYRQSMASL